MFSPVPTIEAQDIEAEGGGLSAEIEAAAQIGAGTRIRQGIKRTAHADQAAHIRPGSAWIDVEGLGRLAWIGGIEQEQVIALLACLGIGPENNLSVNRRQVVDRAHTRHAADRA